MFFILFFIIVPLWDQNRWMLFTAKNHRLQLSPLQIHRGDFIYFFSRNANLLPNNSCLIPRPKFLLSLCKEIKSKQTIWWNGSCKMSKMCSIQPF